MITIYGHGRCGWCLRAKELARDKGHQVDWLNTDDPEVLEKLKVLLPDAKTVPQIWNDSEYVGGYDDLAASLK